MKRGLLILVLWALLAPARAQDPVTEVIRAGVTKAIKAMDLKIQREQNKVIWLQNAQKALENALTELRLGEIADWADKQHLLYQEYYDELRQVRALVADYERLRGIARTQALLLDEYGRVWVLLRQDKRFSPGERAYMEQVYAGMLAESARSLDLVLLVLEAAATHMEDARRLELLRAAASRVESLYRDLLLFNRQNILLRLQRARTQQEVAAVRQLYGL